MRCYGQHVNICLVLLVWYGAGLCEGAMTSTRNYTSTIASTPSFSASPSSQLISKSSSTALISPSSASTHSTSFLSFATSLASLSSSSARSTTPDSSLTDVKSNLDGAVVTPTTILLSSSSTDNFTSTITSAPAYPWANQNFPNNTCSFTATDGELQWIPCKVFAGTIQMSYFPEQKGNTTYPTTFYNPDWDITMTSPWIYMRINTITGDNSCGPLGPTYTDFVTSMPLSDCFTLQPYADHTVTSRMGPPMQLTLSDLESNCLNTYSSFSTDGAWVNTHPVFGNYNRCHPRFVFPIDLKRAGYPYWKHCGVDDFKYGNFDPPGAVPPLTGFFQSPTTVAQSVISTPESASPAPTAISDQAPSTTSPDTQTTKLASTPLDPSTPSSSTSPVDPTTPGNIPSANPSQSADPTTDTNLPVTTPSIIIPTSATAIATVGSQTISAIPGSSGIVLPNGSTAKPGSVATVTGANSKPIVVSVGSSGVYIGGTSPGASPTFVANPTIPPVVIATIASHAISAAPGATTIVVGSQTAVLGGAAITVSNSVIELTPSGVVVSDGSRNEPPTTIAIPVFASQNAPPTPIATVGGQVISAAPGGSTVVINGQVVTAGGAVVTLAGSNNVASLGSAGLVIQYPSGAISTFALPTAAPGAAPSSAILGTIGGIAVSVLAGVSAITIGSQVVSMGGSEVTIAGSDVVSLGPSGLEVQMPGGGISTVLPITAESTMDGTTSSTTGIASIIASIAGATQTASVSAGSSEALSSPSLVGSDSGSGSGSEGLSPPTPIATSEGQRTGYSIITLYLALGLGLLV